MPPASGQVKAGQHLFDKDCGMTNVNAEQAFSRSFDRVIRAEHPTSGTQDDDDDRDDEHDSENEAPVRETDENTEAPEEFEVDDKDDLGHPEDDDADEK
jgi:hypothetical protein